MISTKLIFHISHEPCLWQNNHTHTHTQTHTHTHTHTLSMAISTLLVFFLPVGRTHTHTHAKTVHGNFACYCQRALYDILYIRLIARSPLEFMTLLPSHLHTAPQSKMNTVINLSKFIVFSHDLNNRKTNETSSHSNLKKCESLLTRVRCEQHW